MLGIAVITVLGVRKRWVVSCRIVGVYMICTGMFMSGVQDWYSSSYYNSSPSIDPRGPTSGSARVFRGGYFHHLAHGVRSAHRYADSPDARYYILGVRLLRIR